MIWKASEDVEVDSIYGDRGYIEVALLEGCCDSVARDFALSDGQEDRIAFHQRFVVSQTMFVNAWCGRVAVVPFDVLDVMTGAEASRVTWKP